MLRVSITVVILAISLSSGACASKSEGENKTSSIARPTTIAMVSEMTTGKGSLELVPRGDRVQLTLKADDLPAPPSYSLWLVRKGEGPSERLDAVEATNGRVNFTASYAASRLAKWDEIRLLHQPSGKLENLSLIHPALVAKLPK